MDLIEQQINRIKRDYGYGNVADALQELIDYIKQPYHSRRFNEYQETILTLTNIAMDRLNQLRDSDLRGE